MEPRPRLANRGGDCLLGNWFEERKVKCYDPAGLSEPNANASLLFKYGNDGLITTKKNQEMKKISTFEAAYTLPVYPPNPTKGVRSTIIKQTLAQRFKNELNKRRQDAEDKLQAEVEPPNYNTNYSLSHNKPGFVPTFPEPTQPHNVNTDMGISFWMENADTISGVTDINRKNDPFKKNTTFSKPVTEKYDDALHMDAAKTLQ